MPNVIQCLSDSDYKAKVSDATMASLVRVWEDHTGIVKGRAGTHPPKFDLTIAQRYHFGRLVTSVKLGIPIERLGVKSRRVEVAVH